MITDFVEYIIEQHNYQKAKAVEGVDRSSIKEEDGDIIYSDAALTQIKKYTLFELKSVFRKLIEDYTKFREDHGTLTQYLGKAAAPNSPPSA